MTKPFKIILGLGLLSGLGGLALFGYTRGPARGVCVSGDCENGSGRRKLPDGGSYEGQFQDGRFHGEGTFATRDAHVFSGRWAQGEKVEGVYLDPDGARYIGSYVADRKEGQGTYTWPDGTRYQGAWQAGETGGAGILTLPDGTVYRGIYNQGRIFEGQGVLIQDDGSRHVGSFKDGLRHGPGTAYDRHGQVTRRGLWENDRPVEARE